MGKRVVARASQATPSEFDISLNSTGKIVGKVRANDLLKGDLVEPI